MLIDILLKIIFAMLGIVFGSVAIIVIVVVIREGITERRRNGRQH